MDEASGRGCVREFAEDARVARVKRINGYVGGSILRKDDTTESEFAVINYFDTLDAVKHFAGPNYLVPVFEPEAKALLIRIENYATHYEVRYSTE